MASTERLIWTIAYRKPTGPWFQRVDLELTWHQAVDVARQFGELHPDLVVYYVTTKAHDNQRLVEAEHNTCQLARDLAEDAHNLLVGNKRIKIKDTGKMDPRVTVRDADKLKTE